MMESDEEPLLLYDEVTLVTEEAADQVQCNDAQEIINKETDKVIYGYERSIPRVVFACIISVLTLGIAPLLFHWFPRLLLFATSRRCRLDIASKVLVVETYQKKCKSYFIHRVLVNEICDSDTDGTLNEGFENDSGNCEDDNEKCNGTKPSPRSTDNTAPIHFEDGSVIYVTQYRYFVNKKQVLIWDTQTCRFAILAGIECGSTCRKLLEEAAKHRAPSDRRNMLLVYGLNEIVVPVRGIGALLVLEVFNPFYMFQVFTVAVWLAENYYYYCVAIVCMSVFGIATSVIQTRANQRKLRETVEAYDPVLLLTDEGTVEVDSRQLMPGDIIVLPSGGCQLHCDAALLTGQVIVNESMLTGESVPVTKTALPKIEQIYDSRDHAHHTLFCGTRVIQTRYYDNEHVKALVLRTGYHTSKGQLVRAILYPAPADFKFDRDSYKFIFILAVVALLGLVYTVVLKASRAITASDVIIKALDIITIAVPPALPAAMTVGRLCAAARLHAARVYTLNTRYVNVCGSIDAVCFDKTGTLTEDGLDMWGVVPIQASVEPAYLGTAMRDPTQLNDLDDLKLGMATCHSLTLLEQELAGDPLDLKMFESTGWTLEEPSVPDTTKYEILVPAFVKPKRHTNINVDGIHMALEVGILRQEQFVSSLARGSVVVRVLGEAMFRVYCKGAPEMIKSLCVPESVPTNMNEILHFYAEKGYRVIAMATKILSDVEGVAKLNRLTRDQLETELVFVGLIVLENRLKPSTSAIIRELREAQIHVAMITGDNIHTAVSVAKDCGILSPGERLLHIHTDPKGKQDPPLIMCSSSLDVAGLDSAPLLDASFDSGTFTDISSYSLPQNSSIESGYTRGDYKIAMTGQTWKVLKDHHAEKIPRLIEKGAVFARMSSDQKQQLIQEYQAMGYFVAMCGDGANDCGALRAAHAGISLSEQESSVAAAFTSREPDIRCVVRVIREGRAALVTSFGVFKFMVAYSLTELFSVALLYYFDSNLTDFEFLFIDIALILNFAFFFGKTNAYDGPLSRKAPITSLLNFVPLVSITLQMILVGAFQYLCYYTLTLFPWYEKHTPTSDSDYRCWENYAVFAISMFQYIAVVVAFSHGAPYRKSVMTNKHLIISAVVMTAFCTYLTIEPADWLANFLQLELPIGYDLRYIILILAAIHFTLAVFVERFVVQFLMEEKMWIPSYLKRKHVKKTPHLMLKAQLAQSDFLHDRSLNGVDIERENGRFIEDRKRNNNVGSYVRTVDSNGDIVINGV